MMLRCYVVLLVLISFINRYSSLLNDYLALEVPLIYDNVADSSNVFRLLYSELGHWQSVAEQYAEERGIPVEVFVSSIAGKLDLKKYELLQTQLNSADSHSSIKSLLTYLLQWNEKNGSNRYFLSINPKYSGLNSHHGEDFVRPMLSANDHFVQTLPLFLLDTTDIIIYQSLGVSTGGTTAMNILYFTLQRLGFKVLLCNDSNKQSDVCRNPSVDQLIITGEWCHEVLDEYMNPPDVTVSLDGSALPKSEFLGRGLQYYLGFHHNDDACVGRVALADSHFISKHIGRRQLAAYYLGCPMTSHFLTAFETIVNSLENAVENNDAVQHIKKENLVVIDPDYTRDYPPENPMAFDLPPGYTAVYAQEVPPAQMPLLLQRAKITLDLGMPGPERLSGEAILSGTIPVVSERMNGASEMDFPGVRKVNPYNGSQISEVLEYVATHYEEELTRLGNVQFLHYVLSMQDKLLHTGNVVFGSAAVHFVVSAQSDLHSEYVMNFQVLCLLYLYPLASIDIYVYDVVHYMRHHYTFIDLLKQSGYVRIDPLQPSEFRHWRRPSGGKGFVNVHSLTRMKNGLQRLKDDLLSSDDVEGASISKWRTVKSLDIIPDWNPALVLVKPGIVLRNPSVLLDWLTNLTADGTRLVKSVNEQDVAVVVGPEAVVDLSLLSTIDSFLDSVPIAELPFDQDVLTVCRLLERSADEVPSVVHSITDSIPWRILVTFSSELGFQC